MNHPQSKITDLRRTLSLKVLLRQYPIIFSLTTILVIVATFGALNNNHKTISPILNKAKDWLIHNTKNYAKYAKIFYTCLIESTRNQTKQAESETGFITSGPEQKSLSEMIKENIEYKLPAGCISQDQFEILMLRFKKLWNCLKQLLTISNTVTS